MVAKKSRRVRHAYVASPGLDARAHLSVSYKYEFGVIIIFQYVRDRLNQKVRTFLIDHPAGK